MPTLSSDATFRLSAYLRKDRVPCWNSTMLAPGHAPPPASQASPSLRLHALSGGHDSHSAIASSIDYCEIIQMAEEAQERLVSTYLTHIRTLMSCVLGVEKTPPVRSHCNATGHPRHTRMQHDVASSYQH